MWRKQEEPKVSVNAQNVLSSTPATTVPTQTSPVNSQSSSQQSTQSVPLISESAAAPRTAASIVCKGISIRGQVTGSEDLQIDGEVSGTVQLAGGRVMIGPEGRVAGNIDAREIIVRGELKGNLRAVERILVGGTGRWQGDGISPRLGIEEGALLKGKFEVSLEEAKKPAVPKTVAAKPASVAGKETSVPTGAAAGIGNGNAGNAGGAGQVVSAEVNETTAAKAGTVPSNTLNG